MSDIHKIVEDAVRLHGSTVIDNPEKECREYRENGNLRSFITRRAIEMGRYPNEKIGVHIRLRRTAKPSA